MILSNREIQSALSRGSIKISPDPVPTAWSSTAIDLTLASEITTWKKPNVGGVSVPVCPFDPNYDFSKLQKDYSEKASTAEGGYVLRSGSFLESHICTRSFPPHSITPIHSYSHTA